MSKYPSASGVYAFVGPSQKSAGLIGGVEPVLAKLALAYQRVERRQHQRSVVAPCSGRLTMAAVALHDHIADLPRRLELVRHADRIADQVPPDTADEALG